MATLIPLGQRGARDFFVVEVKRLTSDDLVVFVALASYQDEVAGLCLRDRLVDRLRPVRDLAVRLARALDSLFRITEYLFRIFRERLADNLPAQDILEIAYQEILTTTRLPLSIARSTSVKISSEP